MQMQMMQMRRVMTACIGASEEPCQALSERATMPSMTRDDLNTYCTTLPGATLEDPWGGGHDAWKIGGKMFACVSIANTGVSVKTPDIETASLLIEVGRAVRAPYFHKSWVHLPWGSIDVTEMRDRVDISYDLMRASLTKKVQATIAPRMPRG